MANKKKGIDVGSTGTIIAFFAFCVSVGGIIYQEGQQDQTLIKLEQMSEYRELKSDDEDDGVKGDLTDMVNNTNAFIDHLYEEHIKPLEEHVDNLREEHD